MANNNLGPMDLYWTKYEDKWRELGFRNADELYDNYGALFFDYNTLREDISTEQTGIKKDHLQENLDIFIEQEEDRLKKNKGFRQQISEMNLSNLKNNMSKAKHNHQLKKDAITLGALTELNNITATQAKTGIHVGEDITNLAYDAVKSKINTANASHAYSRKKTIKSIDDIKRNTGYYAEDGDWVEGRIGDLESVKYDAAYNMKLTNLENRTESLNLDLAKEVDNMQEAWEISIAKNVKDLFFTDPEGQDYDLIYEGDDSLTGLGLAEDKAIDYIDFALEYGIEPEYLRLSLSRLKDSGLSEEYIDNLMNQLNDGSIDIDEFYAGLQIETIDRASTPGYERLDDPGGGNVGGTYGGPRP